ncbi:hypothetical protein INS49_015381 [Diaporthe citri]|uniref:uncharacterized protein n=1 Tax=Diaporthe citri TaxID=83186 RepID=UPI001C81D402|nr:uncharacterized protein INS49_015381 [Diaporthe citri]KAG6355996.1 hypothetical protein INS49_015381 [Diaporthe citri]
MSSTKPHPDHAPREGKKEEMPADPPRGRTKTPDRSSPGYHGRDKQADSRSVSRGRTHRRSHHSDGHGKANLPHEDFVYPSPTGGFSPKGRPPTFAEAAYLSDAPHLDYKTPTSGRRRASTAMKSPQPSHIRTEMEAGVEMTKARGGAAEMRKDTKEGSGKSGKD